MANVTTPRAYTCTPSSLLNSSPCLSCLSEKQMLAAMLAILSISSSQTVPTILKNSNCFTCMSKKQMLQGLVTVMGDQLIGQSFSQDDINARMKLLERASQKQLTAALLYSYCTLFGFYFRT